MLGFICSVYIYIISRFRLDDVSLSKLLPKTNLLAVAITITAPFGLSILSYAVLMVYQFKIICNTKLKLKSYPFLLAKLFRNFLFMIPIFFLQALVYCNFVENWGIDIFFADVFGASFAVLMITLVLQSGKSIIKKIQNASETMNKNESQIIEKGKYIKFTSRIVNS